MTKRYREPVEVTLSSKDTGGAPTAFTWRGSTYRVLTVLGHWREDAGYWSGGGVAVPQRDLWRVEARGGARGGSGGGVYELVRDDGRWRLDRLWD